jgi:O-methyltransferase
VSVFDFARRAHGLQTLVVRLVSALHPAIEHNVEKTLALKKAFYYAALEALPGDYVEFGVFEGTSFIAAFENDRRLRPPTVPARAFWGFDSFEGGFQYFDERDRHPFSKEGEFTSSLDLTRKRVGRHFGDKARWQLVPGYFEQSLAGQTAPTMGIPAIAVALVDCDLGTPARLALDFMRPALQNGSVIILDDYFAYRGSTTTGVAGAFAGFQAAHPSLQFRRLFDYGHGGQGFVLAAGGL